ncbi:MAG: hypothetical protein M1817_002986 [Caeruleum heppii]|nr:MAG: hypothetical protein M1817_002986 [Caeruleum heppii]
MHILVINDDGPPSNQSSPYVHSLVSTLQSAGHVVSVVLPHTQRSWIGKAHIVGQTIKPTYFRPGTLHKDDGTTHTRPLPLGSGANQEEWVLVDGTPASCAQIGLHHFFQERGEVDLVVSGPNYGRNTTAVFALSSGTLGGALEAAVCRKKAIALSYAFFSRNHDPYIIAGASRLSVRLIEHLHRHWIPDVDVYSVNVPLVPDVENHKIMYTRMLQNYWSLGSSFEAVEVDEEEDPVEREEEIRRDETATAQETSDRNQVSHRHRHFKWAPKFADVYQSVERSEPGNDGWAVKEGYTSVTPLKANFMHTSGFEGELKLPPDMSSLSLEPKHDNQPLFYALIDYGDDYTQPRILSAMSKVLPASSYTLIRSMDDLPTPDTPLLQWLPYETLSFDHLLSHPSTSLANAYIYRKALIRKNFLSTTVRHWIVKHPDSILKDHVKPTVELELDYAEFLDDALVEAFELREAFEKNEGKTPEEREWWILKPGMSDRGQGIRLFSTEDELRAIFEGWEEDDSDADSDAAGDGDGIMTSQLRHFVAQPYIHPPLLLLPLSSLSSTFTPHKSHLRTYILAINSLQIYIYADILALFAAEPYVSPWHDPSSLTPHLTNTCLHSGSVHRFSSLPHLNPSNPSNPSWKQHIIDQIHRITAETFEAAAREMMIHFQTLPNAFEIFGVDFLVDEQGEVWLLEVNAFPDFGMTGDHTEGGEKDVIQGLMDAVVAVGVGPFFEGSREGSREGGGEEQEEKERKWGLHKVLTIDLGRR